MKLELFHATDVKYVDSIISGNFIVSANLEHWLGNGIYFYTEEDLARWWGTNPTKKYTQIKDPRIIKVNIDIPDHLVLDLRRFKNYKQMSEEFMRFYKNLFNDDCTSISGVNGRQIQSDFFNYYFQKVNVKMIIGTFAAERQSYIGAQYKTLLDEIGLKYTETQVCLLGSAQEYIKSKEML